MADSRAAARARYACDVLLDLLGSDWSDMRSGAPLWPQQQKYLRQLLIDDLVGQSEELDEGAFREVWRRAIVLLPPEAVRGRIPPEMSGQSKRRAADVVVVTVLPVERDAVLVALGEDPNRREDFEHQGIRYYCTEVKSERYDLRFKIWTTMIGEPRNTPMALFIKQYVEQFLDTKVVILVGIAGGNRNKVELGDVVASCEILDDEGGADERSWTVFSWGKLLVQARVRQPRVKFFEHRGSLKNLLNGFVVNVEEWHAQLEQIIARGNQSALKFKSGEAAVRSEYKPGLIQAGERVKKDGSLPRTAEHYHDKLYAVEMEGSGFAQGCLACKLDWLVVRGVSDHGDWRKRDKMQSYAACAAATLTVQFLRKWYRPQSGDEVEF